MFQTRTQSAVQTDDRSSKEPVQYFMNLSLPTQDGSKIKIGFVTIRKENTIENAQLLEALKTPEGIAKVLSKLLIEVNSAAPKARGGLAL